MTTATLNDTVRVIQGRRIERHSHMDMVTRERYWRFLEINRPPPIEKRSYNESLSQEITILEHREQRLLWDSGGGPGEVMRELLARLDHSRNPDHPSILEFDPNPPSPLHDQLARARNAGFAELAEAFEIAAKVKERPGVIRGRFPRGACWVTRGLAGGAAMHREFLRQHVTQESVELDDDSRWCPPLGCPGAENEMAIQTSHGLVRSRFSVEVEETQGAVFPMPTGRMITKYVHVWTLLATDPCKIMTLLH
jgi:hypothetical protein